MMPEDQPGTLTNLALSYRQTIAAYEDPMRSKGLGRWLQGDLRSPK
jgi:hypothetical protein